jgi:hypothetical protein
MIEDLIKRIEYDIVEMKQYIELLKKEKNPKILSGIEFEAKAIIGEIKKYEQNNNPGTNKKVTDS